jgi:hypothetical protein
MNLKIEGKPAPRFRVFITGLNDEPVRCVGTYDTTEEVNAHKWRLDQKYKIYVDRKPMTRRDFLEWAKTQK